MTKTCQICGKRYKTNYQRQVACSRDCQTKRKNVWVRDAKRAQKEEERKEWVAPLICKHCGKSFSPTFVNAARQRYCNPKCNQAAYHARKRLRNINEMKRKTERAGNVIKLRPCPLCGLLRESTWPGDRYHESCRDTAGRRSSAFN